ncbi:MAG: YjfB family protein [Candidatus Accumulibacter sp.]|uniref:YjfB family protein n=1 Tax=Accumulibacter sp. TaxID=2053492 RepID=UPI001DB6368E|nr:YjfB family protein [Accumulibacter sp.]MCB1941528.1 YjfB family protein [Accumulibacter sp.]MCP5249064.1 YjfB family protein [Accumulibacter sp.]
MDVPAIAAMATEISQSRTADAVQTAVLKKALDIQSQNALQLVEAAANVVRSNPPHLGSRIDSFA